MVELVQLERAFTLYETPEWKARIERMAHMEGTRTTQFIRNHLRRMIEDMENDTLRRGMSLPPLTRREEVEVPL